MKDNKKKVLIIGPAHPLRGGLATYDERLCRELNKQGHTCHILSFSLQYPSFLFPGKTQYSDDPAPEGVTIFSEINSVNPLNWLKVGLKYKKLNYDVVIFRYWMSFMGPAFGSIARIIKSNKHTKVLAITDNVVPHERKFFDTPFTKYFLPVCDGFLTMSQAVKLDLEAFNVQKPVKYVPHPMYDNFGPLLPKAEAKKQLGLDPGTNYLLFFGFIRGYKGLSILLDAFADERLKPLNLKLIVAGEFYEDSKPYYEQVECHKLQDVVIMKNDFIPNDQVSAYFSAADVVVQPYTNATQSGVTQIAYYYNKPMIVTNVGGLAELVPDNKVGFVTEVNTHKIAEAIIRFYAEDKEAAFSANIETEKQRFTWQNLCRELLSMA
ncbi:MAG: glycosyltransferase [Bacteroidota bacterium]